MERSRTRKELSAINAKSKKRNFLHKFRKYGHADLADEIEQCGEPIRNDNVLYTARHECRSVYCTKCHGRFVKKQTSAVRSLFDRYGTEAEQRENLVHLTVDFDAFRLYSKKGHMFLPSKLPTNTEFPTDHARYALVVARHALKHKLRYQFPSIGYAGAFEWELFSDETLDWRKRGKEAVMSLLGDDKIRDPRLSETQAHIVLFHAHIVVDLNGTPKDEFRSWMREEFTKKCGLPSQDSVYIQSLRCDRGIEESIKSLARYPLKTYLNYKRPNQEDPLLPINGEAVAELAAFRSNQKWQGIKIWCKPKTK